MTTHRFHADVHTHGLADGCEACEDAGSDPLAFLDDFMLRDLFVRTVDRVGPRSAPEASAISVMRRMIHEFGRLVRLDPDASIRLLAEWGTPAEVSPTPPAVAAESGSDGVATTSGAA